MNDIPSRGKEPHELFKDIDGLCAEIDTGLANQLSEKTVNALRRWIRRSPRKIDECFLAVHERKNLPECCIAWLSTNGYTVIPAKPGEVRGREALMLWRSTLRNLPSLSAETCVFVRGLNLLTVAEQQGLWASWVETLSRTSRLRFAYSFVPFTEEFDHITKYDVWQKLGDRTVACIEDA